MSTDGFTTCLWFDGQAEEAANHYMSIFENSKLGKVSAIGAEFELNGQKFFGLNGGPQYTFTEAISFQIFCDDQDEVDYYWNRLSDGGEESMCGWLKDRYGVSWQVIPKRFVEMMDDPDPEKVKRATEAMLEMKKLDIAALEKAYAGD
jgi:predicted 3-demethylubiquinone-9 3-methyltransferase (glyoxalase superfamily)